MEGRKEWSWHCRYNWRHYFDLKNEELAENRRDKETIDLKTLLVRGFTQRKEQRSRKMIENERNLLFGFDEIELQSFYLTFRVCRTSFFAASIHPIFFFHFSWLHLLEIFILLFYLGIVFELEMISDFLQTFCILPSMSFSGLWDLFS